MVSLVFHTKVSFRLQGQATKTASRGGLGPINIFVHKELRQLNRLQLDLLSVNTKAWNYCTWAEVAKEGGESFQNVMENVATSHHLNVKAI